MGVQSRFFLRINFLGTFLPRMQNSSFRKIRKELLRQETRIHFIVTRATKNGRPHSSHSGKRPRYTCWEKGEPGTKPIQQFLQKTLDRRHRVASRIGTTFTAFSRCARLGFSKGLSIHVGLLFMGRQEKILIQTFPKAEAYCSAYAKSPPIFRKRQLHCSPHIHLVKLLRLDARFKLFSGSQPALVWPMFCSLPKPLHVPYRGCLL